MKLEIFTEEQSKYFLDNYDRLRQLKFNREKIGQSDEDYAIKSRKVHLIMDEEENLRRNMEPFVIRNKEYEKD